MKQKWIVALAAVYMGLGLSSSFAAATDPFITDWDLSKPGSGSNQIQFFAYSSGPVTYSWTTLPASTKFGSGTFNGGSSGSTIIISGVPASATIRLSIDTTNFKAIQFGGADNLINVQQWGTTIWRRMNNSFSYCANLQIAATDVPNLSRVTDLSYMFSGCTILNSPFNINNWDVSNITDMSYMFGSVGVYQDFNQDISNWNVSNVKNMAVMFCLAVNFNQNIKNWNVGNVTDMSYMFGDATSFNQNIGNWNIGNVKNMSGMFSNAHSFNQNLAPWAAKLNPNIQLSYFLDSCGVSLANYDSTLIAFNASAPTGFTMSAAGLKYCAAATARANLVKPIASGGKGWTITGDTIASPSCVTISALNPSNSGSINNMAFIYPNPAQDWATISLANGNEGNIEISNELGQVIYSQKVKDQENISLAGLKSGIYSFKVNQDKSIQHLRVVKQ